MLCFVLTPAPKTYSLVNAAQADTGGVSDKSILKVSLLLYPIVAWKRPKNPAAVSGALSSNI